MNNMRIGGLASGMDIDKIVGDLMKVERAPIDKLKQKKQLLEWQRDAYRDMNRLLNDLDKHIFDGVMRQSTFLQKKVTSSNENKVVATAINATNNTTVQMEVQQLATATTWKTNNTVPNKFVDSALFDATGKLTENYTLTFEVTDPGSSNPRNVTVNLYKDDTIDTVISRLNNSSLGITAIKFEDENERQQIAFINNKTGSGSQIKVGDTDSKTKEFLSGLGFDFDVDTPNVLAEAEVGKDAIVKLNGFSMTSKSNTFTAGGIQYTIKGLTDSGEKVTISTSTNTDAIFNSIKSFVDKYNETIDEINKKLKETRYRDYQPLTDEQREQLTEKQAEKWEEKAKSGILRGDSILSSSLSSMRQALYRKVDGVANGFSQLAQIGITTTPNYLEGGKLIIDEAKLRRKIEENPDAIYRLFSNNGEGNAKGIVRQLRDEIKKTIKSIEDKAGNTLKATNQYMIGKSILDIDTRISAAEDRLKRVEDRYWKQFSAMEKAVQRANSQSMYLMNAFGGGAQ